MKEVGKRKCISSATRQTTTADHFFEQLDSIDDEKAIGVYHIDAEKGWMVVNLPKAENVLRNKGLSFQVGESLQRALQQHPSFLRNGLSYRFPAPTEDVDPQGRAKKKRAWVFDLEWHKNSHLSVEGGE